MTDRGLPPSRFGPGYTVGQPAMPAAPPTHQPRPAYQPPPSHPSPPIPAPPIPAPPIPAPPIPATTPTASARTNPWATVTFFLTLFFGTLVVPLTMPAAVVVRRHIDKTGEGGKGLTTATLLIGCVYLAFGATVAVLFVTG